MLPFATIDPENRIVLNKLFFHSMKKFIYLLIISFTSQFYNINSVLAQVNLTKGLVAWYAMNGNAKSSVGTGEDCAVNGATLTSDRFGNANSAYHFDGSSDLLANFNSTGFSGMSFSCWLRTSFTSGYEVYLQSPSSFVGYINRFTSGHVMAAFDANTSNNASTDESYDNVATGNWMFISASNDGSTTRVYVNGALEATYSEQLATYNGQLEIGGGVGNTTDQFVGDMDEVRIYNRQLSDSEMVALFQAGCPNDPSNGLVAYYPMTGNGNNALGTGMNMTNNGATLTTDRFGNANSAYYFDGSSNLTTNFNTSGFEGISFSAWIKTSMTSGNEILLQSPNAFVVYINRFTTGHIMAAFDANSGNNASTDESTSDIATGNWEFVSGTNDGTNTRIYVNGNLEATYAEVLATYNSQVEIGGGVGSNVNQFVGSVDEVRIYERMLCDNEMLTLYNNSKSGIEPVSGKTENFEIYPNPSNGILNVESSFQGTATAIIFDVSGKQLYSGILPDKLNKINLATQSKGLYFIKIQTADEVITRQFVIQ